MKQKGFFIFSLVLAFVLSLSSEKLFCKMRLDAKNASIQQVTCCETTCRHCDENGGKSAAPLTAKCLETSQNFALTPVVSSFEPGEPIALPFLSFSKTPSSFAAAAVGLDFNAPFSLPFYSGRVLHSVMLHS